MWQPTPGAKAVRPLTGAPHAIRATVSVSGYERELKRFSAGPRRWVDFGKRDIGEPRERNWRLGGEGARITLCGWRSWRPKDSETEAKDMPPKLKTEIVERSMFIFLPDRLLLLLNFSIPNKTFSLNVLFSAPCQYYCVNKIMVLCMEISRRR